MVSKAVGAIALGAFLVLYATLGAEAPAPSVVLDKPLHFMAPDGRDVVASPGTYRVEATEGAQLRLIPTEGTEVLVVQAVADRHDEAITSPVALSIPAEGETLHVVLLLPAGRSLDAAGSWGEVRSRGVAPSPVTKSQVQTALQSPRVAGPLSPLTLSANIVTGGTRITGTVSFTAAPPPGAAILLSSSNPAVAKVPNAVAGVGGQTFPITIMPVVHPMPITITASYAEVTRAATLTVVPPPSLKLVKFECRTTHCPDGFFDAAGSADMFGRAMTGIVELDNVAPNPGATVALASSNPAAAPVPPVVLVRAGESRATFVVASNPVTQYTGVQISASLAGVTQLAPLLKVVPPAHFPYWIALERSTVTGGTSIRGRVTIQGLARMPFDGDRVELRSSNPGVGQVPGSVFVPSSQNFAEFTITTSPVQAPTPVTIIVGNFSQFQKSAILTVVP